jgi:hypothetical protein
MILVLAPLAVVASTAHPVSMEHFFCVPGPNRVLHCVADAPCELCMQEDSCRRSYV